MEGGIGASAVGGLGGGNLFFCSVLYGRLRKGLFVFYFYCFVLLLLFFFCFPFEDEGLLGNIFTTSFCFLWIVLFYFVLVPRGFACVL